jgi:TonB family protein
MEAGMTSKLPRVDFVLLEYQQSRGKKFATAYAIEALVVAFLVNIALFLPQELPVLKKQYTLISLVSTPPPVPQHEQPRMVKPIVRTPKVAVEIPEPKLILKLPPKKVEQAKLEPPKPVFKDLAPALVEPKAVKPKAPVQAAGFSEGTGSSAKPTLALPVEKVQTGGFGDPNGVKGTGRADRQVTIARQGSFDLPAGEGYGNGSGGAHGARGVTVSAGFGNGIASGRGQPTSYGKVQQTSFGANSNIPATPRVQPAVAKTTETSVEILSRPKPSYSDEARNLKLEGEVLLAVSFSASGQVQVLKVIRGLGHGLDENAIRAAEQIRFKPALQDGHPVDSTATLHIIFQLAY